jgi:hypothetical protein
MKKIFIIILFIAIIFACNNAGQGEEELPEDGNAPTAYLWRGRVMVSPDSLNWVSMARYSPQDHPGYDTVVKYLWDTNYSGDLPAEDEGIAAYLTDTTGKVVSKGWLKSEYGPSGGGMIGWNSYNPSIHIGYYSAYYIHINK